MSLPDQRIVSFINSHHVLTLATCNDEEPYCANCFYVYLEEDNSLVFTSDYDTKHIRQVSHNIYVAGSIVLETDIIGKLRGIQFQGIVSEARDELYTKARNAYLKRFPVAMLLKTPLWVIDLTFLKFTDNTLGFGKKFTWEKELIVNPFFSKENK